MLNGDLRLFVDADALYFAAAQRWVQLAEAAIAARGKFHVALSGGSPPRSLYRRLANPDFANRIAWDRMHVYFGDERAVPPDHADSNFRMAKDDLIVHVPIPLAQIHRIEGERADIHEAATKYSQFLASRLPLSAQGVVQFDLLLLGVGTDGHIASLFPGTAVLHERARPRCGGFAREGWARDRTRRLLPCENCCPHDRAARRARRRSRHACDPRRCDWRSRDWRDGGTKNAASSRRTETHEISRAQRWPPPPTAPNVAPPRNRAHPRRRTAVNPHRASLTTPVVEGQATGMGFIIITTPAPGASESVCCFGLLFWCWVCCVWVLLLFLL